MNLGSIKKYLGIEIRKYHEGFCRIKQSKYIETILSTFGLDGEDPSNIHLDTGYLKNIKDHLSIGHSESFKMPQSTRGIDNKRALLFHQWKPDTSLWRRHARELYEFIGC